MVKILTYKPKTKWAGQVWVWGASLNKIAEGGSLKIVYEDKIVVIPREQIKAVSTKQKVAFNKLTGKTDTHYGFTI